MAVLRYFWMAFCIAEIKPCHFMTVPAFLNTMIPLLGVSKFWNPIAALSLPREGNAMKLKQYKTSLNSWVAQERSSLGFILNKTDLDPYPKYTFWGPQTLNNLLFWIHIYTSSSSTASILVERDSAHSIPSWQFL